MDQIKRANEYILQNHTKVNNTYKPSYHLSAPIGWLNDPNGFSTYKDEYHLFYQYYPYDSKWGPMHWGHAKSDDLIKWEHLPVALAPDRSYDRDGCFSGSAIEDDNKLYLFYTGNIQADEYSGEAAYQVQNMAVSEDGIVFHKVEENPIITTLQLPENSVVAHFRDPKVINIEGIYYMVVGSLDTNNRGQVLLYESDNLYNWNYKGVLLKAKKEWGNMWECPDFFELQGKAVLISSPQFLTKKGDNFWNVFSSIYIIGDLNLETCQYDYQDIQEIDYGLDFYAPQTLIDKNGRRIMIAWMQMWNRQIPTHIKGHYWANAMTLPRELKIKDGKLYQYPIDEIKRYRKNKVSYKNISVIDSVKLDKVEGQKLELELEIDMEEATEFGLAIFKSKSEQTVMYYNREREKFVFDRSESAEDLGGDEVEKQTKDTRQVYIPLVNNKLNLRIFLDRMSVEIFIQDGEKVMTSTVFPAETSTMIEFFSTGTSIIKSLNKWDIEVSKSKLNIVNT